METQEQLVSWLRDAHAMELNVAATLQRHVAAAADHPEWRDRLERHLRDTRDHARRVSACLDQLKAGTSAVKDATGNFMGAIQGVATNFLADDIVKNALIAYAMEHFEIASYSALVAAAEQAGFVEIAHTCSDLLREEVQMALWLEDEIPKLTRRYVEEAAAAG